MPAAGAGDEALIPLFLCSDGAFYSVSFMNADGDTPVSLRKTRQK